MEDFNTNKLVERFEHCLESRKMSFFDAEEFEDIILYYLDIYDLEYAERALKEAYKQYPNNLDLKTRELEFQLVNNKLKRSYDLIQELTSYNIENLDFYLCQAHYWSLRKFHKKAIFFYKKSLEFDEEHDFIYNSIGNEYFDLKDYSNALDNYIKALEYFPEDEFAFFSIIDCYDYLHKPKDAIRFVLDYIDKNPYNETAWYTLGQLYEEDDNYLKALEAFDYVIVINPKSIYGYMQKASCFEKLKKWKYAIDTYSESLEYDDTPAYTYYKIGQCYLKVKQRNQAFKAFVNSIHSDPQFEKSWYAIALFYEETTNYEEALFFGQEALKIDSKNTQYLKKVAYFEIILGKYEEATTRLKDLTLLEPFNYPNWIAYLETLTTIGEYEEVLKNSKKALQIHDKSELYYIISNSYFQLKKDTDGKKMLSLAIKKDSSILNEYLKTFPILQRYV
ncbi:MAG: hypothetical protein H6604_02725 [Flavobacteriales bacterium]|nr:hypothetical protein [Flavobacteriales bacterium]